MKSFLACIFFNNQIYYFSTAVLDFILWRYINTLDSTNEFLQLLYKANMKNSIRSNSGSNKARIILNV